MLRRLRTVAGALLYDWMPFRRRLRRGEWVLIRNRNETITTRDGGAHCEWQFTSDLHIAKVFPRAGERLMEIALRDWPIAFADAPPPADAPQVSFVIGHRGRERLPHLLMTLRSIAAQRDAAVECIVVEQSVTPMIASDLPPWVRYAHTPVAEGYDYNRSWTLNEGARLAKSDLLILHDNDMLVPAQYAAEALTRVREGWDFLDLKRFTFYLPDATTQRLFAGDPLRPAPSTVVQNLQGASIVAAREAYLAIGGFDESFVGWGGEDNELWERAAAGGRVWSWGYLPFVHLFHAPQKEKLRGAEGAGVRRWQELASVTPEERIRRLRVLRCGGDGEK